MRVFDHIWQTIGNTPLVRMPKLSAEYGVVADILLKLEFFNPLSSVKDRLAISLIEAGERDGKIKSNIAASDARVEQEKIAYRNELLTAFEEAANAIAAFQRQREREAKLGSASQSARTALDLSIDLEKAGLNDFLSVLDAERGLLDADYQRSIARTQVLVESVALYKALAGGWPN